MRQEVFPTVRAVPIRIRPPERVAMSQHRLLAYKWAMDKQRKQEVIQESVILREMAQADGPLAVYLQIPVQEEQRYCALLSMIGYRGANQFVCLLCWYHPRGTKAGGMCYPAARAQSAYPAWALFFVPGLGVSSQCPCLGRYYAYASQGKAASTRA
jgi:hypothetical protein